MGWVSPTGYNDPNSKWSYETNAYDGNTSTYTQVNIPPGPIWSSFLELTINAINCNKIKYYLLRDPDVDAVDVDVYYSGAWHDIYSGSFPDFVWVEKSLSETYSVTKMRFRFHSTYGGEMWLNLLYEAMFYQVIYVPTITTQAVTNITPTSGKGNGEITATGGENATERGFEYKQGATGTIIKTYDTGSFGTGTFNKVITGLSPNTLYYVRAYAKNSAGIGYGDWVTFTTDKTTPTVVTNEATEVDKDKFKANGNITATGGENCTVRGFQYGLTPIATWDTHDEGSYEAGAFNKVISGLQANTIYYFRAYATNSVGTTYGSWLQVVTASAGTTPSGTKISLVGDYSGYVGKLHASEQDLGANYKGYFVLTTDFAEGQSLAVYKRLLYLVNYFRKETSGEVKISVKCDNETDWREIGTVDLTGDEDILMQEMGVDELGKHFLIKFEGENAFRYLGSIFWYLVQGVR